MKALLWLLVAKFWPAPAPAPAVPLLVLCPVALGGGWAWEFVEAGGVMGRRLVCPTRRRSWPVDPRGFVPLTTRVAHPN